MPTSPVAPDRVTRHGRTGRRSGAGGSCRGCSPTSAARRTRAPCWAPILPCRSCSRRSACWASRTPAARWPWRGEEAAGAGGDGQRWFQLYWPQDRAVAASFLARAKAAGFTALVITVDTRNLAWRPRDLDQAFQPFLRGIGIQNYLTDPAFQASLAALASADSPALASANRASANPASANPASANPASAHPASAELAAAILQFTRIFGDRTLTWADLSFARDHWDGPIVVKGILSVADAERAAGAGMDGIIVSNHGGRQVDGAVAALDALPAIA